jgi:hypothetical protein
MRGEKKLRSDNDQYINSAVTGKCSDPPVIRTGITPRLISRPEFMAVLNKIVLFHACIMQPIIYKHVFLII